MANGFKTAILRTLRNQEARVELEQMALDELRIEANKAGLLGLSDAVKEALKRSEAFMRQSGDVSDNVVATRAKAFLVAHPNVKTLLTNYCFMRGLTQFDVESIWEKLLGNPKPIVIEQEPPSLDFLLEDE